MWEVEFHKKGKRKLGWWLKNTTTNVRVYVARKLHKDIIRSGEFSVSEAMRKNVACFGIDSETMQLCRIKGVSVIGVRLRDTGSLYLTAIENFYDPSNLKIKTPVSMGRVSQRFLPLDQFRVLHQIAL